MVPWKNNLYASFTPSATETTGKGSILQKGWRGKFMCLGRIDEIFHNEEGWGGGGECGKRKNL